MRWICETVEQFARARRQHEAGDLIQLGTGYFNFTPLGLSGWGHRGPVTVRGAGRELTVVENETAVAAAGCQWEAFDLALEDMTLVDSNPKHATVQSSPVVGFASNEKNRYPGLPVQSHTRPPRCLLRRVNIQARMWGIYDWTNALGLIDAEDCVVVSGRQGASACGSGSMPPTFEFRRCRFKIDAGLTTYAGAVNEGLFGITTRRGPVYGEACRIEIGGNLADGGLLSNREGGVPARVAGVTNWYGTYGKEFGGSPDARMEFHDTAIRIAPEIFKQLRDVYDADDRHNDPDNPIKLYGGSGSERLRGRYIANGAVAAPDFRAIFPTGAASSS